MHCQKLQQVFKIPSSALTHNRFTAHLFPVDYTSFEVSLVIHCSGVSSRYCCYGNHTAGFKSVIKLPLLIEN